MAKIRGSRDRLTFNMGIPIPGKTVLYCGAQGAVSIYRRCLTSIGISMLKIRRSRDRLIFKKGIPVPGKEGLYIETRSRLRSVRLSLDVFFWLYITIGNLTRNVHYKTNSQRKKSQFYAHFDIKSAFLCVIFSSWIYNGPDFIPDSHFWLSETRVQLPLWKWGKTLQTIHPSN